MAKLSVFTRPKWERKPTGDFEVTGEAIDIVSGDVIAVSIPVRVTADVLEDADKCGPGTDRLIQGIEEAVQAMAREKAKAL